MILYNDHNTNIKPTLKNMSHNFKNVSDYDEHQPYT